MEALLHSRISADSPRTQRQALAAIGELQALRQGSAEEQFLAWYYLHLGLGYSHTIKRNDQPVTIKGWMAPNLVGKHLGIGGGSPRVLSVAPAHTTTWAVVDIDEGSRYHPASAGGEGEAPVRAALASIGLVEPLEFQSSSSTGVHLWYPLGEAVRTFDLARALQAACRGAGLDLRGGVLELRPNVKGHDADYLTIRAPLTGEGNGLWVDGLGLCDDLKVLRLFWEKAQAMNRLDPSAESHRLRGDASPYRQGPCQGPRTLQQALDRLAEGFTGPGQTQELKLAALQVAGILEGLSNPDVIRERCVELVSSAPGFAQFCGHQGEISSGRAWCRSALLKAARAVPGGYEGTWKQRANTSKAQGAAERALKAIEVARAGNCCYRSEREAIEALRGQGGPARSWWKHPRNQEALQSLKELLE